MKPRKNHVIFVHISCYFFVVYVLLFVEFWLVYVEIRLPLFSSSLVIHIIFLLWICVQLTESTSLPFGFFCTQKFKLVTFIYWILNLEIHQNPRIASLHKFGVKASVDPGAHSSLEGWQHM